VSSHDCYLLDLARSRRGPHAIALVHPVSGSAICYAPLAERLWPEATVVGLQDLGTRAEDVGSLRERAEAYAVCLAAHDLGEAGVGGWSFGGLIALELARLRDGEASPVVLIDPPLVHGSRLPDRPLLRAHLDRLAERTTALLAATAEDEPAIRADLAELLAHVALPAQLAELAPDVLHDYLSLHIAHYRAQFEHTVEAFDGPVTLVVCDGTLSRHGEAYLAEWRAVLGDADVVVVPGRHELLFEDPDSIAAIAATLADTVRPSRLLKGARA